MVVQHNLQAMNANRMLGVTTKKSSTATEKLSSGYRINRAADDAAGLAISEKMRKQIRGLDQASANAEDGISCVQTAEGAMAEVQDMLQRMNELCVQAANGTNSQTDRQYIQDELDQLVSEIDRVAETTKFNETYLLKGDELKPKSTVYITNYSAKSTANIVSNDILNKSALDYKVNYKGTNNVIMVGKDILTSDSSNFMAGSVVRTGDDITKYMKKGVEVDYKKEIEEVDTSNTTPITDDAGNPIDIEDILEIAKDGSLKFKDASATYYKEDPVSPGTYVVFSNDDIMNEYRVEMTGGKLLQQKASSTVDIWYDDGTSTFQQVSDLSDIAYLDADGTIQLIHENWDFFDGDPGSSGIPLANKDAVLSELETISALYDNSTPPKPVSLTNITDYLNSAGQYQGGLYDITGNEIAATDIADYLDIKTDPNINANRQNAIFNADQYVAFINVELNSNVVKGVNGSVDSEVNIDSDYDLSTNGVDEKTRANRDLFIYDSANDTVVHLHEGDEMTDYLNEDNTMKLRYRLVDYISSSNDPASGKHIRAQVTDNQDFVWDDNYIQLATSMQKLYDGNGTIVSGMALNKFFDVNGNYTGGLYTTDQARAIDQVFASENSDAYRDLVSSGYKPTLIEDYITQSAQSVTAALNVSLQAGADADRANKVAVDIDTLTAAGLGIDKLASFNIGIVDTTGDNATDAIDVVAEALQKISRQRSALGAIQNRLEHTISNLDNIVENTTAAESQIRDTDMAEEMVRYSNQNILTQAGQSMLAQANQSNQGVLSLLK